MSDNGIDQEPGRIVVGVDGSASGNDALRWAARLAPTLEATIEVVYAWEYPVTDYPITELNYPFTAGGLPMPDVDWEQIALNVVRSSVQEVFGDGPPPGLVSTAAQGHPVRILLEAARGADMLIVGSRGLGGFTGLLLGSISSHVAEKATCPVLVVHKPAKPHAE